MEKNTSNKNSPFHERRRIHRPHFRIRDVVVDDVFEVVLQGLGVCFAVFDTLEDVEDDACEAVAVEVDFLCVGDLSDLAICSWLV